MRSFVFVLLILATGQALPCSYVGDPPTVDDLLDNLGPRTEQFDFIVVASVKTGKDASSITVIESLKGGLAPEDALAYRQATSCDVHFYESHERLILFGSYLNDRLHINGADGTIHHDHPRYDEAIARLRKLFPSNS